jgi:hypothetical protein
MMAALAAINAACIPSVESLPFSRSVSGFRIRAQLPERNGGKSSPLSKIPEAPSPFFFEDGRWVAAKMGLQWVTHTPILQGFKHRGTVRFFSNIFVHCTKNAITFFPPVS